MGVCSAHLPRGRLLLLANVFLVLCGCSLGVSVGRNVLLQRGVLVCHVARQRQ